MNVDDRLTVWQFWLTYGNLIAFLLFRQKTSYICTLYRGEGTEEQKKKPKIFSILRIQISKTTITAQLSIGSFARLRHPASHLIFGP